MFNQCLTVYIPYVKQLKIDSKQHYLKTFDLNILLATGFLFIKL